MRAGERSGISCPQPPVLADSGPAVLLKSHSTCVRCDGTGYLPLAEGVRLAAYLGDPVARLVFPACDEDCSRACFDSMGDACDMGREVRSPCILDRWLSGLENYPGALVRAAVAVGREVDCCGRMHCAAGFLKCNAREALDAAEAWIADPTEENRQRWEYFQAMNGTLQIGSCWVPREWDEGGNRRARIESAVRDGRLTEPQVRTAIRDALVPWALGEENGGTCRS